MTERPKAEHQSTPVQIHWWHCKRVPCTCDRHPSDELWDRVTIEREHYNQLVATDRDCKFIIQTNVELAKEVVRLTELSGGLELRLGSTLREKGAWVSEWETAQSQLKTLRKHLDPTERRSFDDQKALAGQLLASQNAVEQQRQELGKIRAELYTLTGKYKNKKTALKHTARRLDAANREKIEGVGLWETAQAQLKKQKALEEELLASKKAAEEQQLADRLAPSLEKALLATQRALDEERQQVAQLTAELASARMICAALNKEYPALAEERRILEAIKSFILAKTDNSTYVPVGP
jgi:chromosome segregation ATPase